MARAWGEIRLWDFGLFCCPLLFEGLCSQELGTPHSWHVYNVRVRTRASSVFLFLPSPLHLLGVNRSSIVRYVWRLHPFSFTVFLQWKSYKVLKFRLLRWGWRQGFPLHSSGWSTACCGVRWRVNAKMANSVSARARIYAYTRARPVFFYFCLHLFTFWA